jgi:hypothetical protein
MCFHHWWTKNTFGTGKTIIHPLNQSSSQMKADSIRANSLKLREVVIRGIGVIRGRKSGLASKVFYEIPALHKLHTNRQLKLVPAGNSVVYNLCICVFCE